MDFLCVRYFFHVSGQLYLCNQTTESIFSAQPFRNLELNILIFDVRFDFHNAVFETGKFLAFICAVSCISLLKFRFYMVLPRRNNIEKSKLMKNCCLSQLIMKLIMIFYHRCMAWQRGNNVAVSIVYCAEVIRLY